MKIPIVSSADVKRVLDTMTVEGWIAIYAAVIATINAAWSIYSIWRDKPKLALKANLGFPLGPSRHGPICLYIEVVNEGRRPITVEGIGLKLNNGQLVSYIPREGELPKRLQEGESCKVRLELEETRNEIAKIYANPSHIWARDNTGRKYFQKLDPKISRSLSTNGGS